MLLTVQISWQVETISTEVHNLCLIEVYCFHWEMWKYGLFPELQVEACEFAHKWMYNAYLNTTWLIFMYCLFVQFNKTFRLFVIFFVLANAHCGFSFQEDKKDVVANGQ